MNLLGSCHCQAVSFEVESFTPYPYLHCYCSICRKTAGGGGYAINIMGQWISDPRWPEWVYPFASAIDTPLPKPPERVHILLDYAANWCDIPKTKRDSCFAEFTNESIEKWHKRHHLYKKN